MYEGIYVFLYLIFAYFYFSSIKSGLYLETIILGSIYPYLSFLTGYDIAVASTAIILMLIPFTISIYKRKSIRVSELKSFVPLCLVVIMFSYMLLSTFYSPAVHSEYFLNKLIFYCINIILPCLLITVTHSASKSPEFLIKYLVISTSTASLVILANIYKMGLAEALSRSWFPRTTTKEINSIWLSRYLSYGLFGAIFIKKNSLIKTGFFILILFGIIFTGSKAGIYFSLVLILTYYIYDSYIKSQISLSNTIILFSLFIGLFLFFNSINPLAFERRFSLESGTVGKRTEMISELVNKNERYFIGNGLASAPIALFSTYERQYPHNVAVEVYYELGLLGLLIYHSPYIYFLLNCLIK